MPPWVHFSLENEKALEVDRNKKHGDTRGYTLCHGNGADTSGSEREVKCEELLDAHDDEETRGPLGGEGCQEEQELTVEPGVGVDPVVGDVPEPGRETAAPQKHCNR